jgi:hypothetical protein
MCDVIKILDGSERSKMRRINNLCSFHRQIRTPLLTGLGNCTVRDGGHCKPLDDPRTSKSLLCKSICKQILVRLVYPNGSHHCGNCSRRPMPFQSRQPRRLPKAILSSASEQSNTFHFTKIVVGKNNFTD